MNIRFTITFFLLLTLASATAQQDGYWDKERATTRELTVPAGNRVVVRTEDFPVGTTEVVYRITVLDENQQMASSLVSLLKAVPDPTGISQGSAGAVFLASKVSGDDKCRYAIFNQSEPAQKYRETGKPDKACLVQDTPVNKDAKVLSADKMACLAPGTAQLFFVFESNNWILKQKIILEAVPWVDRKLARGWTATNKKAVVELCKTSDLARRIPDADEYCACVLDKFQKDYKYSEYQKLLAAEKARAFKDYGKQCLNETDASAEIYEALRTQAAALIAQGNYPEALAKLQLIANEGKATAVDYAHLSYVLLLTKQYEKAQRYLLEAQKRDATELLVQLNLAHLRLLQGDYGAAKKIYRKFESQNLDAGTSWKSKVLDDVEAFQKAGIQNDDFARVRKLWP